MAEAESANVDFASRIELGKAYEVFSWQLKKWERGVFKTKDACAAIFTTETKLVTYLTERDAYRIRLNGECLELPGHFVGLLNDLEKERDSLSEEVFAKKTNQIWYDHYIALLRDWFKVEDDAHWYKKENKKDEYEILVKGEWKKGKFKQLGSRSKFRTDEGKKSKNMWLTPDDAYRIRKVGSDSTLLCKKEVDFSLPTVDIEQDKIDWSNLYAMHKSDSGARGVLFCQIDKRLAIVKASDVAASELFACYLGKSLGLNFPSIRVLSVNDHQEFWEANLAINNCSQPLLKKESIIPQYVMNMGPILMVMEFISGSFLIYKDEFTREQLIEVGKILAFDIFLQNRDRIPTGFGMTNEKVDQANVNMEEGNAQNIMVSDNGTVWGIDNEFGLLPLGEQLEKYCSVGLEAISQSFDPAAESSSIQNSVVSFFETQGIQPLPENGWDAIREGLESGCKSIAKLTSKELLTIHEKVSKAAKDEAGTPWGEQMAKVRVDSLVFILENLFQQLF